MKYWRKRLFEIIELSSGDDRLSSAYDWFMIVVIVISLFPLAFKRDLRIFQITDYIAVSIFILDYLLRFATADYKYGRKSFISYFRYPFSFWAIIDLISILPSITILNSGFKLLRIFRMMRAFRVIRVFKAFRYSKSVNVILAVFKKSKSPLLAVCTLAAAYILISALVIFNVEPDSFATFFDAIYWATVSLTTMGYGDIYPVTTFGRAVTMISSIFGIAIVALPAGIITAGYMSEISENSDPKDNDKT